MLFRVFAFTIINFMLLGSAFGTTYIRDYTYTASEADSKISSRVIALDQVKTILLQEIGTHIRQTITIKQSSNVSGTYASDDIEAITAGLTKVEILEEKWNGITYYLKAKIDADTDKVLNALDEFKKSNDEAVNQQMENFRANQKELKKAREEIDRLKYKLSTATTEKQKHQVYTDYQDTVESMSASEMVDKGYDYAEAGRHDKAFPLYKKAADLGNALALNNLGDMYLKAYFVKKDYYKAVRLFREAADKGSALAQSNLGFMYLKGYGIDQNYNEAVRLFRQASAENIALADSNLGYMYLQGYGVNKDYDEAVRLFRKAESKGNTLALTNLGFMYLMGNGVNKNYTEAVRLFKLAANQGHALGKSNLGYMYLNGFGVTENIAKAKSLFQEACDGGNQLGCSNLKIDAFK